MPPYKIYGVLTMLMPGVGADDSQCVEYLDVPALRLYTRSERGVGHDG